MKKEKLCDVTDLVARILLAALFVIAGVNKILQYHPTQAYMASAGVPGMLLPLVILLEAGGGLAIIAGFKTRIVSVLMAGFCLLSALLFHFHPNDALQTAMFLKNLAVAGGFLLLFTNGAGKYSLDARMGKGRKS